MWYLLGHLCGSFLAQAGEGQAPLTLLTVLPTLQGLASPGLCNCRPPNYSMNHGSKILSLLFFLTEAIVTAPVLDGSACLPECQPEVPSVKLVAAEGPGPGSRALC